MFLSIIVPVYNTERYLPECLLSLLQQDISENEYEIICVNDGSTDGSFAILHDFEDKYSNIVVIDKVNEGVATARNKGMDVAKGEYIWFVDSDDLIKENVLGTLQTLLLEQNYDRLMIGVYVFPEQLSEEDQSLSDNGKLTVNAHYYDSSVCSSVIKREFLLKHNCFFKYPEITHGEDSIFMYEVVSCSPKQIEWDVPVYFYRTRPNSAQTNKSEAAQIRRLQSYIKAAEVMKGHWERQNGDLRDTANLLMSYIWYSVYTALQVPARERKRAMKELRNMGLYPYRRLNACTHMRSYQTTRTDFVGKMFDKVYINMHRPWGYYAMYVIQYLIHVKHGLLK